VVVVGGTLALLDVAAAGSGQIQSSLLRLQPLQIGLLHYSRKLGGLCLLDRYTMVLYLSSHFFLRFLQVKQPVLLRIIGIGRMPEVEVEGVGFVGDIVEWMDIVGQTMTGQETNSGNSQSAECVRARLQRSNKRCKASAVNRIVAPE
jgi:hypothetical protein